MAVYVGKVIAGIGKGQNVIHGNSNQELLSQFPLGVLGIQAGGTTYHLMNADYIHSRSKGVIGYRVLSASNNISGTSAAARAAAGAFIAGPIGLAAGFTAKRKEKYTVQVTWGSGLTSVIELDAEGFQVFQSCM